MKDEEMAEQFADNVSGLELTCSVLASKDKSHAYRLGRYEGFLAGLKAGRPQWHDLRKNPNDLPKRMRKSILSRTVLNQIGTPCHYNYELECWQNWSYIEIDTPVAWCEIHTFDKE